jgi:hypothetical protein
MFAPDAFLDTFMMGLTACLALEVAIVARMVLVIVMLGIMFRVTSACLVIQDVRHVLFKILAKVVCLLIIWLVGSAAL